MLRTVARRTGPRADGAQRHHGDKVTDRNRTRWAEVVAPWINDKRVDADTGRARRWLRCRRSCTCTGSQYR